MPPGELSIEVVPDPRTPTIRACGEIDLGTVDALRSAASEVVRQNPEQVIFDFRDVLYIDSSGLAILVATYKRLGRRPGSVTVVSGSGPVQQSLQITGLDHVIRVVSELACPQALP